MTSSFEQQVATNFRNAFDRIHNLEAAENPIVASMYTQSSGTTTVGTSATVINYDTLVYDNRNCVTVGAAWAYVCQIAGLYQVNAAVRFAGNSGWNQDCSAALMIYVNGSQYKTIDFMETFAQETAYTLRLQGSALVHLAVGDSMNIRSAQDADGAGIATVATATLTWVDIYKVVS